MELTEEYRTDDIEGDGWRLMLGDSCERLAEIEDESVGLSVYSPPFGPGLYVYTGTERDVGNAATFDEFNEHYGFIVAENLRVTKPGRLSCVHVMQYPLTKVNHGVSGLYDLRGDIIRTHVEAGWVFHGEVTIGKDPQAQAVRTKAQALLFVQMKRDAAFNRPALGDYVLLFRKPGDNSEPIQAPVDNETWIKWARPVWRTDGVTVPTDAGMIVPDACWEDIRESKTLNERIARENADERHICPLQLDLIERCVKLWSNKGDLVLSPFAGIGSEGYMALKLGRRYVGCELKESYWRQAVKYLTQVKSQASLFDELVAD